MKKYIVVYQFIKKGRNTTCGNIEIEAKGLRNARDIQEIREEITKSNKLPKSTVIIILNIIKLPF